MDDDKPLARLLVADDDSDITQVLKLGLQKNWLLVGAFTSPEEVLQSFTSNAKSYCLVLSDIWIPNCLEYRQQKKVNEANPSVKVVLMIAFEIKDNELSKVFSFTQVGDFIQRPIGIGDLTNTILSLIGATKRRI